MGGEWEGGEGREGWGGGGVGGGGRGGVGGGGRGGCGYTVSMCSTENTPPCVLSGAEAARSLYYTVIMYRDRPHSIHT